LAIAHVPENLPPKVPPALADYRATRSPRKSEVEKRELGQFFTPPPLADFIASFLPCSLDHWRMIDAGAGAGRCAARSPADIRSLAGQR
jgi:hypothetical protein